MKLRQFKPLLKSIFEYETDIDEWLQDILKDQLQFKDTEDKIEYIVEEVSKSFLVHGEIYKSIMMTKDFKNSSTTVHIKFFIRDFGAVGYTFGKLTIDTKIQHNADCSYHQWRNYLTRFTGTKDYKILRIDVN